MTEAERQDPAQAPRGAFRGMGDPAPRAASIPRRAAALAAAVLLLASACAQRNGAGDPGWERVPVILRDIVPPVLPGREFDVTAFGARGDGAADCTAAFRRAVDACAAAGGGRVVVPPGEYLTGPIRLVSRTGLHVERGATVLFSRDPRDYLPPVFTRFEGVECMNYSPLIYALEQEDIAVTGEGILDGQADHTAWWPWKGQAVYGWREGLPRQDADVAALGRMAAAGLPVAGRVFGEGHYLRPSFIQPLRCRNVLIEGVTIRRSPMWVVHPVLCENVTVRGVTVQSHGPNNDGCDPESSKNVLIENCLFDTGDDCIAVKSGRNEDGRRVGVPSENIVVRGCTMKDGHGGVVIGSEISGDCRNVYAENCDMNSPNLERALRIKTNSFRGGVVENIHMRDIRVGEVSGAVINVSFLYQEGDAGAHTPVVRDVFVRRLASRKSRQALLLEGYERSPISNVRLEDCVFEGVSEENVLSHVKGLRLTRVTFDGPAR